MTTNETKCPHGNALDCYPPCTLCPGIAQVGIGSTLGATVKTRDAKYGGFENVARITQQFKTMLKGCPSYLQMTDVEKEGLEMVLHKCARLMSGDPHHRDSWHDIQGYAKLVEDRLPPETVSTPIIKVPGLFTLQQSAQGSPRADGFAVDGT